MPIKCINWCFSKKFRTSLKLLTFLEKKNLLCLVGYIGYALLVTHRHCFEHVEVLRNLKIRVSVKKLLKLQQLTYLKWFDKIIKFFLSRAVVCDSQFFPRYLVMSPRICPQVLAKVTNYQCFNNLGYCFYFIPEN